MLTRITSSDRSDLNLKELRNFKSLLQYLSLRDVSVRYKQTKMGFAWSIARPVINISIFACLSYIIERNGNFKDKFIVVFAGYIFWQLISTVITDVSNSLSANSNILTKVYFPKIILPVSSLLVCLVDFAIAFILFLIAFVILRGIPPWQIIYLPFVIILALVFSFAIGVLVATASVRFRDVKFILPFFLQILFYATPVFISTTFFLNLHIPVFFKFIYQIDPLVFIINAFKFCFFGTFDSFSWTYFFSGIIVTLILTTWSLNYFLRFEKSFADYI